MTVFTGTIGTVAPGETDLLSTHLATFRDALKAATEAGTAWTPTITNLTVGAAVIVARYSQMTKWFKFRVDVVGGAGTAATGALAVPLPSGLTAHASGLQAIHLRHYNGTNVVMGGASIAAGATAILLTTTAGAITTFSNGHEFTLSGEIELA